MMGNFLLNDFLLILWSLNGRGWISRKKNSGACGVRQGVQPVAFWNPLSREDIFNLYFPNNKFYYKFYSFNTSQKTAKDSSLHGFPGRWLGDVHWRPTSATGRFQGSSGRVKDFRPENHEMKLMKTGKRNSIFLGIFWYINLFLKRETTNVLAYWILLVNQFICISNMEFCTPVWE